MSSQCEVDLAIDIAPLFDGHYVARGVVPCHSADAGHHTNDNGFAGQNVKQNMRVAGKGSIAAGASCAKSGPGRTRHGNGIVVCTKPFADSVSNI